MYFGQWKLGIDIIKNSKAKSNTKFQLVPPRTCQANYADRSIQTFKKNFKSVIVSLDPNFRMTECDRLLNQLFLTIDALREVRSNPALLEFLYLN